MSETVAGTPNGLASLAQKRARRAMPPPRHPSRKSAPTAGGGREQLKTAPPPARTGPTAPTARPAPNAVRPAATETPAPAPEVTAPQVAPTAAPARPATVYLDEPQVTFLEQARVAGLLSSPRLDLSKSAVVRLALRRLEEQMSVEEICALLRSQPVDSTRTGRKKR